MPASEPTPQRSRIAAARERAKQAKAVILGAAVLAFFVAAAVEQGAHHGSASSGSAPAVSPESSDDGSGFFESGGLTPSQGQPSTSTHTS